MFKKLTCLLLILIFQHILTLDSCGKQITCHDCIRDSSVCVWCRLEDYNGTRCMPVVNLEEGWCQGSFENPQNLNVNLEKHSFDSHPDKMTQMNPQKMSLKLRAGQPFDIPFHFKATENYPVDLYFLIDVSRSMNSSKTATADQSENIYQTMKKMTNDVYLGLGTFIDKNTLPYILNYTDNNLTYSFKHHLNLKNDYKKFKEATDATLLGDNRDHPEGGLDALAQAMACKNIGWRDISRKIIVYLTDAPYHAAGDGRLGGIFQPYDGECYTENGAYTKELEMDYPSESMINKLAREKDMIIIFAIPHSFQDIYQRLSSSITGSKVVTLAANDNIGTTLKNIYEEITAQVKLNWYIRSGHKTNFDISFEPDCTLPLDDCVLSGKKEHNFTATIKLLEYDEIDRAAIDIVVEGFNAKLALDIEVIKDCNCSSNKDPSSPYCHNETRVCGVCECNNNRFGDRCTCVRNANNNDAGNSTCITGNMTKACNEKGWCECGTCNCMGGYGGTYCECDLNSCPRDPRGFLCGGKDHGECQCDSKCKCHPGWSGEACICDTDLCIRNETVCNNRGSCECETCKCKTPEKWDSRKAHDDFCVFDSSPETHDLQCKILQDCAHCYIKQYPSCPCSFTEYEIFEELPASFLSAGWNVCSDLRVDVGCYTNFTYMYDDEHNKIILKLQSKMDCAELQYAYGAVFLLSLLLLGIFTLVAWKLFTEYRDRNEYLRFEKDYQDIISEKCSNPVYQPATTSYPNPAFGKRSITR